VALQRRQDELFWDDTEGGWFSTTGTDPTVLVRMKEDYDGAEPTASSISVLNLLFLSHLIDEPKWRERIDRTLALFGPRLSQIGRAVPMMAAALSTSIAGVQQIVIVGSSGEGDLERSGGTRYRPFAITLPLSEAHRAGLSRLAPFLAGMRPLDGRPTAYVCRNFVCRQPVTTLEELESDLRVEIAR
jgi:uncharacterized protein YyaL (SSP411 family)